MELAEDPLVCPLCCISVPGGLEAILAHTCSPALLGRAGPTASCQQCNQPQNGGHWSCQACRRCFPSDPAFAYHVMRCHKGQSILHCPLCSASIKNKHHVEEHMRTHLPEKEKHFCENCHKAFRTVTSLKEHAQTVHAEGPPNLPCHLCDRKFHTVATKRRHIKRSHLEADKRYPCPECDMQLKTKQILRLHMRIHTGEKPYKCSFCDKCFRSSTARKSHEATHSDEKNFECDICHMLFGRSKNLKQHMQVHTGEKPYKCKVCFKSFRQSNTYKSHMRVHSGEKPYKCDICQKRFTQRSQLRVHQDLHTDETFPCYVCDKVYNRAVTRDIHYRIYHIDREPSVCSVCDKSFITPTRLRVHMQIHSDLKKFKCKECGAAFKQRNNLQTHMKQHAAHGGKRYKCELCDYCHVYESGIRAHMRVHRGPRCSISYCRKQCADKASLTTHMESHTEVMNRKYKCDRCIWTFNREYTLKKHRYNVHGDYATGFGEIRNKEVKAPPSATIPDIPENIKTVRKEELTELQVKKQKMILEKRVQLRKLRMEQKRENRKHISHISSRNSGIDKIIPDGKSKINSPKVKKNYITKDTAITDITKRKHHDADETSMGKNGTIEKDNDKIDTSKTKHKRIKVLATTVEVKQSGNTRNVSYTSNHSAKSCNKDSSSRDIQCGRHSNTNSSRKSHKLDSNHDSSSRRPNNTKSHSVQENSSSSISHSRSSKRNSANGNMDNSSSKSDHQRNIDNIRHIERHSEGNNIKSNKYNNENDKNGHRSRKRHGDKNGNFDTISKNRHDKSKDSSSCNRRHSDHTKNKDSNRKSHSDKHKSNNSRESSSTNSSSNSKGCNDSRSSSSKSRNSRYHTSCSSKSHNDDYKHKSSSSRIHIERSKPNSSSSKHNDSSSKHNTCNRNTSNYMDSESRDDSHHRSHKSLVKGNKHSHKHSCSSNMSSTRGGMSDTHIDDKHTRSSKLVSDIQRERRNSSHKIDVQKHQSNSQTITTNSDHLNMSEEYATMASKMDKDSRLSENQQKVQTKRKRTNCIAFLRDTSSEVLFLGKRIKLNGVTTHQLKYSEIAISLKDNCSKLVNHSNGRITANGVSSSEWIGKSILSNTKSSRIASEPSSPINESRSKKYMPIVRINGAQEVSNVAPQNIVNITTIHLNGNAIENNSDTTILKSAQNHMKDYTDVHLSLPFERANESISQNNTLTSDNTFFNVDNCMSFSSEKPLHDSHSTVPENRNAVEISDIIENNTSILNNDPTNMYDDLDDNCSVFSFESIQSIDLTKEDVPNMDTLLQVKEETPEVHELHNQESVNKNVPLSTNHKYTKAQNDRTAYVDSDDLPVIKQNLSSKNRRKLRTINISDDERPHGSATLSYQKSSSSQYGMLTPNPMTTPKKTLMIPLERMDHHAHTAYERTDDNTIAKNPSHPQASLKPSSYHIKQKVKLSKQQEGNEQNPSKMGAGQIRLSNLSPSNSSDTSENSTVSHMVTEVCSPPTGRRRTNNSLSSQIDQLLENASLHPVSSTFSDDSIGSTDLEILLASGYFKDPPPAMVVKSPNVGHSAFPGRSINGGDRDHCGLNGNDGSNQSNQRKPEGVNNLCDTQCDDVNSNRSCADGEDNQQRSGVQKDHAVQDPRDDNNDNTNLEVIDNTDDIDNDDNEDLEETSEEEDIDQDAIIGNDVAEDMMCPQSHKKMKNAYPGFRPFSVRELYKKFNETEGRIIPCKVCKIDTPSTAPHHSCPKCQQCYSFTYELKNHVVNNHRSETGWTCPICFKDLINKSHIEDHLECHANLRQYPCDACCTAFNTAKALRRHIRSKHGKVGPPSLQCDQCTAMFHTNRQLKRHTQYVHTTFRPHRCTQCQVGFKDIGALKRHEKHVHLRLDRFKCRRCDVRFKDWETYKQHWNLTHDGEKRFQCDQCDKAFKRSNVLALHKLLHSGVKQFSCNVCGRDFYQKMSLARHIKNHASDHPYYCRICHSRYSEQQQLVHHEHEVHREVMKLCCMVCMKECSSRKSLFAHMRVHAKSNDKYKCYHCGIAYENLTDLRNHFKIHNDKNESQQNSQPSEEKELMTSHSSKQKGTKQKRQTDVHHGWHKAAKCLLPESTGTREQKPVTKSVRQTDKQSEKTAVSTNTPDGSPTSTLLKPILTSDGLEPNTSGHNGISQEINYTTTTKPTVKPDIKSATTLRHAETPEKSKVDQSIITASANGCEKQLFTGGGIEIIRQTASTISSVETYTKNSNTLTENGNNTHIGTLENNSITNSQKESLEPLVNQTNEESGDGKTVHMMPNEHKTGILTESPNELNTASTEEQNECRVVILSKLDLEEDRIKFLSGVDDKQIKALHERHMGHSKSFQDNHLLSNGINKVDKDVDNESDMDIEDLNADDTNLMINNKKSTDTNKCMQKINHVRTVMNDDGGGKQKIPPNFKALNTCSTPHISDGVAAVENSEKVTISENKSASIAERQSKQNHEADKSPPMKPITHIINECSDTDTRNQNEKMNKQTSDIENVQEVSKEMDKVDNNGKSTTTVRKMLSTLSDLMSVCEINGIKSYPSSIYSVTASSITQTNQKSLISSNSLHVSLYDSDSTLDGQTECIEKEIDNVLSSSEPSAKSLEPQPLKCIQTNESNSVKRHTQESCEERGRGIAAKEKHCLFADTVKLGISPSIDVAHDSELEFEHSSLHQKCVTENTHQHSNLLPNKFPASRQELDQVSSDTTLHNNKCANRPNKSTSPDLISVLQSSSSSKNTALPFTQSLTFTENFDGKVIEITPVMDEQVEHLYATNLLSPNVFNSESETSLNDVGVFHDIRSECSTADVLHVSDVIKETSRIGVHTIGEKQSSSNSKDQDNMQQSEDEIDMSSSDVEIIMEESAPPRQQCHLCRKHFSSHCQLLRHELRHLGYRCCTCKKMYATIQALEEHRKTHHHRGLRPYQCEHCGWGCHRKKMLVRHLARHDT